MLESILTGSGTSLLSIEQFAICILSSLLVGVIIAFVHTYKNTCSRNFIITLVLLPAIVEAVIMVVNGNLGTGVAVAGAFGLIRFRSMPGTSREIGSVFLAMACGLAIGMGYIGLAILLAVCVGIATIILVSMPEGKGEFAKRDLKITIPENLDYNGIFDDIFGRYTDSAKLMKVKTVNMGSLYELSYQVSLKKEDSEKEMMDEIRTRNGNLSITCGRVAENRDEL